MSVSTHTKVDSIAGISLKQFMQQIAQLGTGVSWYAVHTAQQYHQ